MVEKPFIVIYFSYMVHNPGEDVIYRSDDGGWLRKFSSGLSCSPLFPVLIQPVLCMNGPGQPAAVNALFNIPTMKRLSALAMRFSLLYQIAVLVFVSEYNGSAAGIHWQPEHLQYL